LQMEAGKKRGLGRRHGSAALAVREKGVNRKYIKISLNFNGLQ
jgi:hypothetical protein